MTSRKHYRPQQSSRYSASPAHQDMQRKRSRGFRRRPPSPSSSKSISAPPRQQEGSKQLLMGRSRIFYQFSCFFILFPPLFADCLSHFSCAWSSIATDWVLKTMEVGCILQVSSTPPFHSSSPCLFRDSSHEQLLTQEVQSVL